jgi:hypothetical protein
MVIAEVSLPLSPLKAPSLGRFTNLVFRSLGIVFVPGSSTGITRSRHARLCSRKGAVDLGLPRCVVYNGETRNLGRVGSAKSTGAGNGRWLLEDREV